MKDKAEDFLNELVKQYNIDAINDKSEVSKKQKILLMNVYSIGQDLAIIQDRCKDFKIENNITGLSKEGELALETASINKKS